MKPEKKEVTLSTPEYKELGIREELIPVIQKLGLVKREQFQEANPNKLFNDVCGMRKKLKLKEVKNPAKEEVEGWIEAAGH